MKRKLLLSFFVFSIAAYAQQPISHFQGTLPVSGDVDGVTERFYFRGIPSVPVDQSPQGVNASWDFSAVSFILDHHDYKNSIPDSQATTNYPGCNFQTTITEDIPEETANVYANYTDGAYSILRADGEIMTLDYSVNNAFVGQFPMDYGYISSDATGGNFTYNGSLGTFQGTFAGTLDSYFDAYGTLSYKNDDGVTASTTVSRLKVTQVISLSVPFLPDAGNLIQTSYYYFSEDEFGIWPFIRSIETTLVVPILGINENLVILEKGTDAFLGTPDATLASVSIYPNPTSSVLHVNSQHLLKSVELFSIDGKKISKSPGNSIDVSNLNSGLYRVGIDNGSGIIYKKFIKK
ncbi:T9SS type A sorting domain-containing protein [Flavobacterium silvaticum]|uniref:T9SS type A sorting domain-containing protein n=1 Tax=Flavobacterium silvaticum TaxID=1852020 RepID=A0A972FK65_9FLAO|nr:T9SS type A sorting domain-containing protein [Flavobacterium silvaticum]NMH27481.1 T9SS type A sorting domain-containing protein [Flavobacterium silvaticum]